MALPAPCPAADRISPATWFCHESFCMTGSDVVEHSELDLDMADIEAGADLLTAAGFTAAFTAYSEGGAR